MNVCTMSDEAGTSDQSSDDYPSPQVKETGTGKKLLPWLLSNQLKCHSTLGLV